MSKFYQNKKFKALRDKWYGKLQKEGFPDIEAIGDDGEAYPFLHSCHGCYSSSADARRKYLPSKQRYYELARAFYWEMDPKEYNRDERDAFYLFAHLGMSRSEASRKMGKSSEWMTTLIQRLDSTFLPAKRPSLSLVK